MHALRDSTGGPYYQHSGKISIVHFVKVARNSRAHLQYVHQRSACMLPHCLAVAHDAVCLLARVVILFFSTSILHCMYKHAWKLATIGCFCIAPSALSLLSFRVILGSYAISVAMAVKAM